MSNRSSRIGTKPVSRKQLEDRQRSREHRRPPWLWIGLIGLVVVAGVVAVIASRGSNHKTASLAARNKASGIEQTRPVIVSGTPLPALSQANDAAVGMAAPSVTGNSFDGAP